MLLKGKQVLLRPIVMGDLDRLLNWFNDPEVTRNLNTYLPMHEEGEREWIRSQKDRRQTDMVLAIVLPEQNRHIGTIGLGGIHARDQRAMLGIAIGDKEYQGKGYGTEAIQLFTTYAFNQMNLRRIELFVIASNKRARRCYEKCGFVKEGILKKRMFRDGKWEDELFMALTRPL